MQRKQATAKYFAAKTCNTLQGQRAELQKRKYHHNSSPLYRALQTGTPKHMQNMEYLNSVHIIQKEHIWHILHNTIFVMFSDCYIIVKLSVTLRTTNDSTRSRKHCLLVLLRWHIPPSKPAATPSHSQPCRTRHAQGDPCCGRA